MLSRGMAGESLESWEIFSSNVILEMSSLTRCSVGCAYAVAARRSNGSARTADTLVFRREERKSRRATELLITHPHAALQRHRTSQRLPSQFGIKLSRRAARRKHSEPQCFANNVLAVRHPHVLGFQVRAFRIDAHLRQARRPEPGRHLHPGVVHLAAGF